MARFLFVAWMASCLCALAAVYKGGDGYIVRVYREDGLQVRIFQDGIALDEMANLSLYAMRVKARTVEPRLFDFKDINSRTGQAVWPGIWEAFRTQYSLDKNGEYFRNGVVATPTGKLPFDLFLLFIASQKPTLQIDKVTTCKHCSGAGRHSGMVATGGATKVTEVLCEDCAGFGKYIDRESFTVAYTGSLPMRPTLAELVAAGLVVPGLVVPVPAPLPPPIVIVPKVAELTADQKFEAFKGSAQLGDTQAMYELALMYAHESRDRPNVGLDKFEAVKWMTKAVNNNHKLAQFRLGGYYETAFGVKRDLAESLRWRASSAYLGCKQAQMWIADYYWHLSLGYSPFPTENITRDPPANLREAYAWFSAAADAPMGKRLQFDIPAPDELAGGKQPMSPADYTAERVKYELAPLQRDSVAKSFVSAEEMALGKERVVGLEAKITSERSLRPQK
jgi:hypothetical protein